MRLKNNNSIVKIWLTPKFPEVHYKDDVWFLKMWLFNPIKRWLAHWYLKFLQKFTDIRVIGITGSAGKTTTKEMLAAVLGNAGPTVYSKENIDPVYNIPNTILRTPLGTKYLILEMGVEYPNEMDFYLWLAKPDIGVITNIFPTHLEFMGSIDGVLKEKSKLVLSLDKSGAAILNSNDKKLMSIASKIKAKVIKFDGGGSQLESNSSAARETAKVLGIDDDLILAGLSKYQTPRHRMTWLSLRSGAKVLDDTYNSNPEALSRTLDMFVKESGKNNKIAVIGDMKELGKFEEKYHRELGRKIALYNFKVVIGVGSAVRYLIDEIAKLNPKTKSWVFSSQSEVLSTLKPYLLKNNYILIKGSRSIGLDKLVDSLT